MKLLSPAPEIKKKENVTGLSPMDKKIPDSVSHKTRRHSKLNLSGTMNVAKLK